MSERHLHIVTHDVPWPADFGGVVDPFYKLVALHKAGIRIHLHCFTHQRPPQDELNKYCSTVQYYPRKKNISRFSLQLPFIVNSRVSETLIDNLQKDGHPVLLEGIHCTYYLHNGALNNRKTAVRLHNTEFEYYQQLANHESGLLKKLYFRFESRLLKQYEKKIAANACLLAVSRQDLLLYRQYFNAPDIHFLPVFLPYTRATGKEGRGSYCLYHGNLSINENEQAVSWLLNNVFNQLEIPFVIAGKDPSQQLQRLVQQRPSTTLVANPSETAMGDLIANAQVNVLPSFNATGVKLKLLNALFNGRHCLVNPAGVDGSSLEDCCRVATGADDFKNSVMELWLQAFTQTDIQKRNELLAGPYNADNNAAELLKFLY